MVPFEQLLIGQLHYVPTVPCKNFSFISSLGKVCDLHEGDPLQHKSNQSKLNVIVEVFEEVGVACLTLFKKYQV